MICYSGDDMKEKKEGVKPCDSNGSKSVAPGEVFEDLLGKMAELRGPDGCPWDKEQDHLTLKKYLIEEAYEAAEAIESGDPEKVAEELGDVLLQVIFHSQIASEKGDFVISDVLEALRKKLVERHPHVFGELSLGTSEEVLKQWEEHKMDQKNGEGSILDGIPKGLPTLPKAVLIQERVRRVGFDWEEVEEVIAKLREEVAEFESALNKGDREQMQEELGDVLFSLVNLARFVDLDPEHALAQTVDKFCKRFKYIEQQISKQGRSMDKATLAEMDLHWEQSKTRT